MVLTVYICLGHKSRYYLAVFRIARLFEAIFSLDGGNEKQALYDIDHETYKKWFASGESNVFRLSRDYVNGSENEDSAPISLR